MDQRMEDDAAGSKVQPWFASTATEQQTMEDLKQNVKTFVVLVFFG